MENYKKTNRTHFIYAIASIAAISGLLFGLDLGVISGALPFIHSQMNLNTMQEGWVASSVLFGAALGAIISSYTSFIYGRRNSLILSSLVFAIASLVSASANTFSVLIIARVALGISVGVATYNAPLYLAEISPANIRGRLISLYQLMIAIGILIAFISDLFFTPSGNWRAMLGIIAIPAFIMLFLLFFLPRSPRWLMLKGKVDEAKKVLEKCLNPSAVEDEIHAINNTVKSHKESIWKLLKSKPYIMVLLLAMGLQVIQQFSGMNAMLYFAPEIFSHAGFSTHTDQMWATISIGIVNVITTLFAMRLIETLGRRTLLILSGLLILISTTSLAYIFSSMDTNNIYTSYMSLISVFLFIIGYALGFAPVVWTICAEVFPLHGRSFGMCVATTTNWVASGIVGIMTLPLITHFGISKFYFMLALFAICSLLFIVRLVPETQGMRLEKITAKLWKGMALYQIGK